MSIKRIKLSGLRLAAYSQTVSMIYNAHRKRLPGVSMVMKEVLENLADIEAWAGNAPNPTNFGDNDDYMTFMLELMSRCLYLMKLGVALVSEEQTSKKGYTKHRAIVVGHMVRIVKLYEGAVLHMSKRQGETASIFFRLILPGKKGHLVKHIRPIWPLPQILWG